MTTATNDRKKLIADSAAKQAAKKSKPTAAPAPAAPKMKAKAPTPKGVVEVPAAPEAPSKEDKAKAKLAKQEALTKKMNEALEEHGKDSSCEHCEDPLVKCQAEQVRILHAEGFKIGDIARMLGVDYHQAYNPIFRLRHPYKSKKVKAEEEAAAAAKK